MPRIRSYAMAGGFLLLGGTLALLGGCAEKAQVDGEFVTVAPAPFEVAVEELGVVEATRVAKIVAPFSGKLLTISESGSLIEKDQVVAVLNSQEEEEEYEEKITELETIASEFATSVESLKIGLRESVLQLDAERARLAYDQARYEDLTQRWARTNLLEEQGVAAQRETQDAYSGAVLQQLNARNQDWTLRSTRVDKASTEVGSQGEIERTLLRADKARNDIEDAQEILESSRVSSPSRGIFMRMRTFDWRRRANSEPKPGDDVRGGQILGTIPDLDSMVVKTQVSERDWQKLREGMEATLHFDALSGTVLKGVVTEVGKVAIDRDRSAGGALAKSPEGNAGQKVFEVTLAVQNATEQLRPGLSAQVRFVLDRRDRALVIPLEALSHVEGKPVVTLADGTVQPVRLGLGTATHVIVEEGLEPGSQVLVPKGSA